MKMMKERQVRRVELRIIQSISIAAGLLRKSALTRTTALREDGAEDQDKSAPLGYSSHCSNSA